MSALHDLLTEASNVIEVAANELRDANSIGERWDDEDVRADYEAEMALVGELRRAAAGLQPVITPLSWPAEWTDVRAVLPEPLHDVLVAWSALDGEEPTVDIAYRKPDGRWVLMGSDPEQVIEPSHWMALPAVPGVPGDDQEAA